MQEVIRVAVDAMGGDNAPGEIVKGAIEAVNTRRDIQVVLVGQQEVIAEELKKYTYEKDQIEIKNATEVIETAEHPVNAIRKKKDSSIVVGMNMVKQKEADAFVSVYSCRLACIRRVSLRDGVCLQMLESRGLFVWSISEIIEYSNHSI